MPATKQRTARKPRTQKAPEAAPDLMAAVEAAIGQAEVPAKVDLSRPHDGLRRCGYAGHEGQNPLPATVENFPVRKSNGKFVGYCRACAAKSGKEYAARKKRGEVHAGDNPNRGGGTGRVQLLAKQVAVFQDEVRMYSQERTGEGAVATVGGPLIASGPMKRAKARTSSADDKAKIAALEAKIAALEAATK
jgi:hypothetical protein